MNFKKYLLKLSAFTSLLLASLATISCSNNQNIPPVDYEMINVETNGLAFNSKGKITKFYNFGGSIDINLVIPEYLVNNRILTSEYYGYKQRITEIGNDAFSADPTTNDQHQWAQYLNSIALPNSIETIGADSFYGTSLKEIIISDSVTYISSGAFENCTNLANVTLSNNIKYIESSAFYGTAITKIDLPNTLISIGTLAFSGTQLSGTLEIPDSVKKIGSYAFRSTQITKVIIPADCILDTNPFPEGCDIKVRGQ